MVGIAVAITVDSIEARKRLIITPMVIRTVLCLGTTAPDVCLVKCHILEEYY